MATEARYKLTVRYEVQKVMVDPDHPGHGEQYTGERLSIEDSLDLASAVDLRAVLARIQAVHDVIAGL